MGPSSPVTSKVHRHLAGEDDARRTALPAGEFLHPWPLAAVILLAVNDHVLKGSGLLPNWLTGKLSDFAGLFLFPLLVTALLDCFLLAVARLTGIDVDFSLRRWKMGLALAITALLFVPLKFSPAW